MQYSNVTGLSLPIAVWLAADDYDFHPGTEKAISVTSLLKSPRQILLRERLTEEDQDTPDISDRIAARLGHSIHDSIEKAWRTDFKSSMKLLGYPDHVIDRVVINPQIVTEGMIPVYLEQRESRIHRGYRISGKFDMLLDGEIHDFKSTSAYTYVYGSNEEKYRLQGSFYRWLNPEKVTADHMYIQFVFTDWQRAQAKQSNTYPQQRILSHRIDLMSLAETEEWLDRKLDQLEQVAHLPEPQLPYCSDEELWRGETKWKYFSDPNKTDGRATKNFTNKAEADAFAASKGKGIVIEYPGLVKACAYCDAFNICSQKDLYEHG
jgi:hypothetical protein